MEGILDYVRSFLVLFLLIKVLLYLIPKSSFSKYISFFSGMILVIGILHPILQIFDMDEVWLEKIYDTTFEKQVLEVSANAKMLEEKNEFWEQQIKTSVETEIKKEIEAAGVTIEEVSVVLTDDYQVKTLTMILPEEKKEEHAMLIEKLQTMYQVSAEQCEIVYE